MKSVGIICEYNPFHNGHLYHINKIKELFPDYTIILVMSGPFMQRGECSLIDKWSKTDIALSYDVDLVIELPFVFASQSADIFAYGAISILNELKVDKLVFGSETGDINLFNKLVDTQLHDVEYNNLVKKYMDSGINYPTALSKSLYDICKVELHEPNDLLGLSYVKQIRLLDSNIEPLCIKRTNNYHELKLNNSITSASSIREGIKNGIDISPYVPEISNNYLHDNLHFIDSYYDLLKYKINSTSDLSIYQTVDEGIEYRIKKNINNSLSMNDLIEKVKTKRYTYNKIRRMFTHILCSFTKDEATHNNKIQYIRVLGFDTDGQSYLNRIKNELNIPLITGYSNISSSMLDIEYRVNCIYASTLENVECNKLIDREKNKPIKK